MAPSLTQYVPRWLLEGLEELHGSPSLRRFDGAVLFIDIAGFSALTDRYSRRGFEGAEQLSVVLDTYFGLMTETAIAHGGDVVDFIGDGMEVIWPSSGDRSRAVLLATQCGLALQNTLRVVTEQAGIALQQRATISAGELAQFIGGGIRGQWSWMIAGSPVADCGASYPLARPGDVIVCQPAWALIGDRCEARELALGSAIVHRICRPTAMPDVVLPRIDPSLELLLDGYVSRPLLDRFRAQRWHWLGEFRHVTTLFVGIQDLDLASADVLEQIQSAVECVQRELEHYGGSLESLSMDDKGVSALTAFGLPGTAHEGDALRALRAAMSIAEKLHANGRRASMGVSSGRVFYGDSGGDTRRRVALLGTTVNLASRLMVAADGGILCDEATKRSAERGLTFNGRRALTVKGWSEPVSVYCPAEQVSGEPLHYGGTIIGRETEQRHLKACLEALISGTGGLVLVRGEAGIGKSRLLADVLEQARQCGIRGLTSAGSAIEVATPYFPWRRILAQLLSGPGPFDQECARAELARRFEGDEESQAWIPLLNDVLPLQIPGNSITEQIEGAARASSIRRLLTALLQHVAAVQPAVLVVDDFHWFDEASATALAVVIHAVPNLLVLIGTRPLDEHATPGVESLIEEAEATALELDSLTMSAVERLICQKLEVSELPGELADFVFARAGGNPFYSEELVLALHGAGLFMALAGVCTLSPDFETSTLLTMPNTLHGVIVSRVDRLGPVEQLVLKIASVIGREFSLPMLRGVDPILEDVADLHAIIDALLREDMVRRAPDRARGEYAVKHAILQDVVYDLLPFVQRRGLHRHLAQWLERNEAANLEPFYTELAIHWERAEAIMNALEYRQRASSLAFSRYANRESVTHIHKGFVLAEKHGVNLDDTRVADWELMLGDAYHELFEYGAAAEHFKRSLSLIGQPVPETSITLAAGLIKELLLQFAIRARLAGRSMAGSEKQVTNIQRASHIHERLAEIAYFDNQPLPLLYETLASLNLAERARSTHEVVDGFAALSIGCLQAGQRGVSSYYNRHSLALAHAEGSLADIAYAHLVDMVYWATQGGWSAVAASHDQAAPIYAQLGARVRWHQTRSVLCTCYFTRGLFAQSEQVLRDINAEFSRDTPAQVRSWAYCAEMAIALARGAPSPALIERLQQIQTRALHRADRLHCQGLVALALLRLGERERAVAAADAALAMIAESVPTPWHITAGIAGVAEVYLAECEAAGSSHGSGPLRAKATAACRALRSYANRTPVGLPRAAVLCGRLELLHGRRQRARRLWQRAIVDTDRLQMPYDQGRALYEMGSRLHQDNGEGPRHLQRAREIFTQLGARHDLLRATDAIDHE